MRVKMICWRMWPASQHQLSAALVSVTVWKEKLFCPWVESVRLYSKMSVFAVFPD